MNRKSLSPSEWPKFVLLLAFMLGAAVRLAPVALNGFPLNDGGMFYVMTREIVAKGFAIPFSTQYNQIDIPFAYPPLGFFISGLISSLFKMPEILVFQWLPVLINIGAILAFYFLASQILRSAPKASLATVFFALVPRSFGWQIMGGGVTRAFGALFLILAIAFAYRMFRGTSRRAVLWTALFASLAVLSHPETAFHAAVACVLLWLFFGRSRRGVLQAIVVTLGVLVLTAPWWATVLSRYGLAPVLSAFGTSGGRNFQDFLNFLSFDLAGEPFFPVVAALGLIGAFYKLAQREYYLTVWMLVHLFAEPRGGAGVAIYPLTMLAAIAFVEVLTPALRFSRTDESASDVSAFIDPAPRAVFFGLTVYLMLGAGAFGYQLVNTSLKSDDRATFTWINENIPARSRFVLLTGKEFSMTDPIQEWFPALTHQHSQTTIQGNEWLLGDQFVKRHENLVEVQGCASASCLEAWSTRTGLDYQYVLVNRRQVPEELLTSLVASKRYESIYDGKRLILFAFQP